MKIEVTFVQNAAETVFVNAILLVQDVFYDNAGIDVTRTNQQLKNVEIYVGKNSDYAKNEKCTIDGTKNGASTFLTDGSKNYGIEVWCNKPGNVVTITADLSSLANTDYEMTVTNLGVFGTVYKRDTATPRPKVYSYEPEKTFLIDMIYTKFTIGNV